MDIFKSFLCGSIFVFSLIWTRNFIGDVVYLGELPSLAYAVSASVTSMAMLGSILWGMKIARDQEPARNRRIRHRTRRIIRG